MPHPSKKQRLTAMEADLADDQMTASANDLRIDVLANILGCLHGPKDIMQKRRVCKKWKEAVKMTVVPPTDFRVSSLNTYNAMAVMTRAMPNLQQLEIGGLGRGHKWSDGEDPDEEEATETADYTTHDFGMISNFRQLKILKIDTDLNGRYPFLFNSFPLLQKLSISCCRYLKWDLEMIAGMPVLKELNCTWNCSTTGNISSLRVLKDTLEKVTIFRCKNVEGNFMDLADFPYLKVLNLLYTDVTGDIRDIGKNVFSSLGSLILPKGVYGGTGYELQRISDGSDLMRLLNLFNKQRPNVIEHLHNTYWVLLENSPDWYESADDYYDSPPFNICLVKAGPRVGYRWETDNGDPSEVNWLDPEPERESSDYRKYIEELEQIKSEVHMLRGFHQPPAEEEYHRLWEEYNIVIDD